MTSRAQAALVTRAMLRTGPRAAQLIEPDSELPIAQIIRSDRPNLEYIVAEPVGWDSGWALTAVDNDGRRMRYMEDGQPEFDARAERWRRPVWILATLGMLLMLWWLADGGRMLDQAGSSAGSFALVAAGVAIALAMGRFMADALLRL